MVKRSISTRLLLPLFLVSSLAGCFDFEFGEKETPEPPSQRKSIGFDTTEGDFGAIYLPATQKEPALAVMKPTEIGPGGLVFVFSDGGPAILTANEQGRLGSLVMDEHRFDFEYADTKIVITHTDPDGTASTEEFDNTLNPAAYSLAAWDDPKRDDESTEQYVRRFVGDFRAPLELNFIAGFLKRKLEAANAKIEQLKKFVNEILDSPPYYYEVKNELSCETETQTACAEIAVSNAPQLMEELPAIDPNRETTAGFKVTDEGIHPKREEWDPLIIDGKISTDFSTIDVPCEKSVFADMNPECPQYVEPGTNPGGCKLYAAAEYHEYTYECDDHQEYLRPQAISGNWIFSRYQPDGGEIRDQLDIFFDGSGVIWYYSVDDFEYDAEGRETMRERKSLNLSTGEAKHWTLLTGYTGDIQSISSTEITCYPTNVSKEKYTIVDGTRTTVYDTWYSQGDPNYDRTGCPIKAELVVFGKHVFPDADMTMEYIKASEIYQRYLLDK